MYGHWPPVKVNTIKSLRIPQAKYGQSQLLAKLPIQILIHRGFVIAAPGSSVFVFTCLETDIYREQVRYCNMSLYLKFSYLKLYILHINCTIEQAIKFDDTHNLRFKKYRYIQAIDISGINMIEIDISFEVLGC